MLTTGWSTFVVSKRLVAGDAFVFLRFIHGILRYREFIIVLHFVV